MPSNFLLIKVYEDENLLHLAFSGRVVEWKFNSDVYTIGLRIYISVRIETICLLSVATIY